MLIALKSFKSKQTLYTLCFLCLVAIDFIRGSQDGDWWGVAVNVTGFLMTAIMLSHFSFKGIRLIPFAIWHLLWIAGASVGYILVRNPYLPGKMIQYWTGAVNVVCLGSVLIRVWQGRAGIRLFRQYTTKDGQSGWRRLMLPSIWLVLTVCMTLSVHGSIWQVWFFVMFGLYYLVPFSREETRQLWDGMANGIILGFFALQIYAYGFRPYDETRYKGAYSNCHGNALLYLVTLIMLLYRLHTLKLREKQFADISGLVGPVKGGGKFTALWKVFYYVMIGGQLSFIFFTISRTGMVTATIIVFIYGIITVFAYKEKVYGLLLRWLLVGLCALATLPCVYLTIRWLPCILHHPTWYAGEYSVEKVHSFDPYNSYKYVSLGEFMEAAVGRLDFYEVFLGQGGRKDMDMEPSDIGEAGVVVERPSGAGEAGAVVEGPSGAGEAGTVGKGSSLGAGEGGAVGAGEAGAGSADAAGGSEGMEGNMRGYILSWEDALDSSKVRREIYRLYIRDLNIRGHFQTDGYYQISEHYHAWHAQNVFLQIAYYYGIPAGLLFIILIFAVGISSLRRFLMGKEKQSNIIPLLVWLLFVCFGMLESVWYPGQLVLTLLFIVQKRPPLGEEENLWRAK